VSDAEIGEVAPVFQRPADLDVADDHTSKAEPSQPSEELGSAWKEMQTRNGGRAQGTSDRDDIQFRRIRAKGPKRAGEQPVSVLHERAIILPKLASECGQHLRCVELGQQPPEFQAWISAHMSRDMIGP
jgi:hypothetical protein